MRRSVSIAVPGLRVLITVALALAVAACSTTNEPASDPLAADDFGVTREDVLAGVQAREEHIQRCMDARGYDYQQQDPAAQVVFDGDEPGWGSAYDLLQLARRSEPDPTTLSRPRPAGYDDAVVACADEAWSHQQEREQAVAGAVETLDRAWQEFRASEQYTEAVRAWSTCMASHGHDIAWPHEVRDEYYERLTQAVDEAGGPEHVEESVARVFLDEEVALRAADDDCRSTTLTPVEQEYRRTLFAEEAEAVRRIRDAQRG